MKTIYEIAQRISKPLAARCEASALNTREESNKEYKESMANQALYPNVPIPYQRSHIISTTYPTQATTTFYTLLNLAAPIKIGIDLIIPKICSSHG